MFVSAVGLAACNGLRGNEVDIGTGGRLGLHSSTHNENKKSRKKHILVLSLDTPLDAKHLLVRVLVAVLYFK